MLSRTSTGFSVRKRKPRMRFCLVVASSTSRIGLPSRSDGASFSSTASSRSLASRSAGVPWRPDVDSFSMRFSMTDRSASTNSRSSRSRSRHASTDPSGCGTDGSSNARTTWSSSSAVRRRASWSAGISAARDRRLRSAARAGRRRSRRPATSRLGLKSSVSLVSRSSGTLTTPALTVMPPKPPVSASPRVSVLKTVVLPERASPTIATCILPSVAGVRVDEVGQRLAARGSARGCRRTARCCGRARDPTTTTCAA